MLNAMMCIDAGTELDSSSRCFKYSTKFSSLTIICNIILWSQSFREVSSNGYNVMGFYVVSFN